MQENSSPHPQPSCLLWSGEDRHSITTRQFSHNWVVTTFTAPVQISVREEQDENQHRAGHGGDGDCQGLSEESQRDRLPPAPTWMDLPPGLTSQQSCQKSDRPDQRCKSIAQKDPPTVAPTFSHPSLVEKQARLPICPGPFASCVLITHESEGILGLSLRAGLARFLWPLSLFANNLCLFHVHVIWV